MLVSVSHAMSTSPVTEYVAPALADTLAARSPAIEYVAPTPVVTYAAPSSEIVYVAPAALQKIGHEHEHTLKEEKKIR